MPSGPTTSLTSRHNASERNQRQNPPAHVRLTQEHGSNDTRRDSCHHTKLVARTAHTSPSRSRSRHHTWADAHAHQRPVFRVPPTPPCRFSWRPPLIDACGGRKQRRGKRACRGPQSFREKHSPFEPSPGSSNASMRYAIDFLKNLFLICYYLAAS